MATSPDMQVPNKEQLYGEYLNRERWADKLYRRAAHKSLDIPDDDMQIYSDNRRSGASIGQSLATIALGGLLGAGGLAAGMMLQKPQTPAQVTPVEAPRVSVQLGQIEDYPSLRP